MWFCFPSTYLTGHHHKLNILLTFTKLSKIQCFIVSFQLNWISINVSIKIIHTVHFHSLYTIPQAILYYHYIINKLLQFTKTLMHNLHSTLKQDKNRIIS